MTQRAKEIVLTKRIAEANGLDYRELSLITRPGDIVPGQQLTNTDDEQ